MNALAQHEERAQRGILEFADEMTIIRDQRLYPNANTSVGGEEPWNSYCKTRWGMSPSYVNDIILAAPVLRRRSQTDAVGIRLSVSAAKRVATLDEEVQDAILDETTNRDEVAVMAKAARNAAKAGLPVAAQIEAAQAVPPKPKKKKQSMKDSRFIRLLSPALSFTEDAADYAQSNVLTDMENDWAWATLEKMRLHVDRIAERLHKPGYVRDWNDEAAALLAGDES